MQRGGPLILGGAQPGPEWCGGDFSLGLTGGTKWQHSAQLGLLRGIQLPWAAGVSAVIQPAGPVDLLGLLGRR